MSYTKQSTQRLNRNRTMRIPFDRPRSHSWMSVPRCAKIYSIIMPPYKAYSISFLAAPNTNAPACKSVCCTIILPHQAYAMSALLHQMKGAVQKQIFNRSQDLSHAHLMRTSQNLSREHLNQCRYKPAAQQCCSCENKCTRRFIPAPGQRRSAKR